MSMDQIGKHSSFKPGNDVRKRSFDGTGSEKAHPSK